MKSKVLLGVDGAINLLLGVLLLAFPRNVVIELGMPDARPGFYASILGGVLFGIGLALVLEARSGAAGAGLGLGGAILINLSGGATLAGWLLFGRLDIPLRGYAFLWTLVALLVGLSLAESRSVLGPGVGGGGPPTPSACP